MRRKDWEPVEAMLERLSVPEPNTGCHIWQGKTGTGGYAYIAYRKATGKRLHRKAATVALELAGRPRPKGLQASHVCPSGANRACVNPEHLIWETGKENWYRSSGPEKFGLKGRQKFACDKCGAAYVQIGVRKSGRQAGQAEYGCRVFRAERARQWREENPDAYRAWFLDNKDHVNQTRRVRRRKHGSF